MASTGYTRKRQQTRKRLIAAGMVVLARNGPAGARVAEIAAEAGVATGTFYNHFPSLADLIDDVTGRLVTGVEIGDTTLAAIENDAAVRVAIGTHQLLSLVEDDPVAAAAFVRLLAAVPEFGTRVRTIVAGAVADGMATGRFPPADVETVADACLGSVVQWIRSLLAGEGGTADIADRLIIMSRLVGLDPGEAEAVVARALASRLSPT